MFPSKVGYNRQQWTKVVCDALGDEISGIKIKMKVDND